MICGSGSACRCDAATFAGAHQGERKEGVRLLLLALGDTGLTLAAAGTAQLQIALVRSLISSYFEVVRKRICDSVPKAVRWLVVPLEVSRFGVTPRRLPQIMAFLVNALQENLHNEVKC